MPSGGQQDRPGVGFGHSCQRTVDAARVTLDYTPEEVELEREQPLF